MNLIRSRRTPAEPSAQPTDVDPAQQEPAAAADPPESAEQLQMEASEVRERAEQARTRAAGLVAAAQTEAAGLIDAAEAHARTINAEAAADVKTAARLEERAGYLRHAAEEESRAEDAERRAGDLVAEWDRLAEKIPGLNERITELTAERETLGGQLAEARAAADVDAITELRIRTEAVADALSALTAQRMAVSERLGVIGDGRGHGDLARLYAAARARRASLRRLLNILDPDRPEAIRDQLAEEFQLALRGNLERLREQTAPAQERQVVMIGQTPPAWR